ncbi:YggS family pyridoxal phosphate-dependent enzyme [Algicola sagamiensis]|uniref:YggS family pyridoxal phosphate-dependent enzyme n=1 Tax=Algicola sagamiensis TaxID=163869 RepID=UPI000367967A|nr:YggS family pyridoxal phosphate-dependent enzyme [Algicola sagamiensis]
MNKIADRLQSAYDKIGLISQKYGNSISNIRLVAVSKTKPVEDIRTAYEAGQRAFGENYAQEAHDKANQLADFEAIEWHYIGPIQSNKTKILANSMDWVQTIDREKIARRLHEQRDPHRQPLNVLIQVNLDEEESKSGVSDQEVLPLAQAIIQLERLKLRGIMAIPQKSESFEQQRKSFAKVQACFQALKSQYPQVDTLSMGMSGDLEAAIAEGATMVRIGSAIFGPRN